VRHLHDGTLVAIERQWPTRDGERRTASHHVLRSDGLAHVADLASDGEPTPPGARDGANRIPWGDDELEALLDRCLPIGRSA
jgi:hypothetical protein